ncbi:hypothetical protein D7V86_04160 [bacterium D16-51]|nr:hypothetical protein D7V96_13755 [bacterium D16-59]RKI61723.1 hypothetical protein D7V86_04160 [bacterium D16-51]
MTEKNETPAPSRKPDGIITTHRNGQTIVAELFFSHSGTGSFRTKADSITGNKIKRNGGRKKFNVNFIVKTGVFLYN